MSLAEHVLSIDLPCDPHAPAVLRSALVDVHDGRWPLDDGLLVASELVTNAVRHSGCASEDKLEAAVGLDDGCLCISVRDPGASGRSAQPVREATSEAGGWGLRIIEDLSTRWGAERDDGYCVWAELAVGA